MTETAGPRTCEAHGEATRITCVDCGTPLCPRCMVRTEVGHKCEDCASPAGAGPVRQRDLAVPPRWRSPWLWTAAAGLALVIGAAWLLAGRDDRGAGDGTLEVVGAWQDAADLTTIRGTTTAVGLEDGRVLAAGGGVGSLALSAAELYDPGSDTWASTGELVGARRGAAAAPLPDGRVLVAGGIAEGVPLATAEVYDPASGSWSEVDPMSTARLTFTLTPLPDGSVLAVGGTGQDGEVGTGGGQAIAPQASAEVFDPASGTWEVVGSMAAARFEHTATPLPDGRVLVVGGLGGEPVDGVYEPLVATELYDPAVAGFTGGPALATGRSNHVAVGLSEGRVAVAGGLGAGDPTQQALATVELYDPGVGGWSTIAPLRQARAGAGAVALPDGAVLVAGGEAVQGGSRRSLATAELLRSPTAQAWVSAGRMVCARSEHALVGLTGGGVLALAGDAAFPGEPPQPQGCVDRWTRGDG